MTQKTHYWSGVVEWAKVHTPEEYNGQKQYTLNLYLDPASIADFERSGSKKELKENANGSFVKLVRKDSTDFKSSKTGETETIVWGPPKVVIKDANGEDQPFKQLIGNGSRVTCKVELYDTKRYGKGTRLVAVRVDELVEYNPSPRNHEDVPF